MPDLKTAKKLSSKNRTRSATPPGPDWREVARLVANLKKENQILRDRLPKRIVTTPEERRTLQKAGRIIGSKLRVICFHSRVDTAPSL